MRIAITRKVSRSITCCELTHLERIPIDLERAREQHAAYEAALRSLGVEVHNLAEEPDLPDSVFVEDAAVVLDECAVLTRPGAASRQAEVRSISLALAPYRSLLSIQPPGTLDGGDVLVVGKHVFIGLSRRSNQEGLEQVKALLTPFGYRVHGIPVTGCLHLKSAVTQVGQGTLLINPAWVETAYFPAYEVIPIHPAEPYAANALLVGDSLLYQPAFPKTLERLLAAGISPLLVDASELGKAEGALTCCSLLFTV